MFDAGAIVGRMTLDLNSWSSAVEKVRNDTTSMQGWILRNQAQVTQLGRAFTIAGAAITGAYALSAKSAISFESAFAGVRKTVDATEAEFSRLSKSLIDMSNEMPMSASNLAGIMEIAGQLGVRGVNNLTKFTETVAKISVTTNLTKESAATDFARIANIMQEPLTNVDRMGSAIVDLGNNFATTEAEISSFAQRIAGSAKVVGLATSDIFGIGTAFSSVGVRAERGGTAVSKALIKIGEAIKTGNSELKTFAQVSGMTTNEFKKAFEQDAGQAFARFIDGLGRGGLQAAQILEDLELGDQRLKQAFLSVGGAGGILTEALNKASIAWKENTALTEEARKRFATTQSILQKTWNTVTNLAAKIGDLLLPAINRLSNTISNIIINIQKWIDNNKTLATVLTYAGVALGVLLTAIGLLALALPGIIASMILFKTAIGGATIAIFGLDIALGPVIITIVAVAAAIAAVILVMTNWQSIISFLKITWWSFAQAVNSSLATMTEALANWADKLSNLPIIGNKFKTEADKMRKASDELRESAEFCGQKVYEAVQEMDAAASSSVTDGVIDKISDAFNKLKDNLSTNVMPQVKNDFNAMEEFGKRAAQNIQDAFGDFFYKAFKGQIDSAQELFESFGDAILQTLAQIIAQFIVVKSLSAIGLGGLFNIGHAEGIDSVPSTGVYRLHAGERVVPKYDATGSGSGATELTIINQITPEAVATAMSGQEGFNVIVNTIDTNALRNGSTRRTIRRK